SGSLSASGPRQSRWPSAASRCSWTRPAPWRPCAACASRTGHGPGAGSSGRRSTCSPRSSSWPCGAPMSWRRRSRPGAAWAPSPMTRPVRAGVTPSRSPSWPWSWRRSSCCKTNVRFPVPDFVFTELLPIDHGHPGTPWRLVTTEGVTADGGFLRVDPAVLTRLAFEAVHDISHLLRPGHLQQLRNILDDPDASANDRFVATDLLKNACIAAGGVLPMCQDTGTAIVMGKKGERVLTGGRDEEAISRGVF